ncbi:MAG: SsrA-binding protein [Myxococcota bacterium]|jgi:SsrA-binding protein
MSKETARKEAERVVATNRRARHEYDIEATYEAGMVLRGSEVKSLRAGAVTIGDGYVIDVGDALFLANVHIAEYLQANQFNHETTRRRKLLLHHREISDIKHALNQAGRTCIPLRFYFKRGLAKVEIGIAKGRKTHDKRQNIKERDDKREMARARRHDPQ